MLKIQQRDMKGLWNLFEFRSSPPDAIYEKICWKYSENLQENAHAEVGF